MKTYWLRSTLFNIAFYGVTALACIACLPTLFLPRHALLVIVRIWLASVHFVERTIMGLDFEIRGLEHLPAEGAYIIAAKHQSAYETMKLHPLFGDPAIILKQELLKIPLWGSYLKKSDVIAIDRSSPETAITSIQDGGRRMKAQGRPIIIFPQGTRVKLEETSAQKPYKVGVARIQEAIEVPIIPMALNTGYFWPRKGWLKKPGRVIFEFLPPIQHGLERSELLQKLEQQIETKSRELVQEAIELEYIKNDRTSRAPLILSLFLAALFILYSIYWWKVSEAVKQEHSLFLVKSEQTDSIDNQDINIITRTTSGAVISGYPGPIRMKIDNESIRFPEGRISISEIKASSWPFPHMPVHIETGTLIFQSIHYVAPFTAERFSADIIPRKDQIEIHHAFIERGTFQMLATGSVKKNEASGRALVDITLSLKNFEQLTAYLHEQKVIDSGTLLFANAGLKALENNGVVTIALTTRDQYLYAGPFLIGEIPF